MEHQAVPITTKELEKQRAEVVVLDVRRAERFDVAPDMIEGAVRADPQHVDAWARALTSDRKVVVYCVFGHEVGQSTAAALCAHGIDARYLEGGIEQWKQEGRPVQPKGNES